MTRFEELTNKLRELFELDKADLDFGIHRIIKSKHVQVDDYLQNRLPAAVQAALGDLMETAGGNELEDLEQQLRDEFGRRAFNEQGELDDEEAQVHELGVQYITLRDNPAQAIDGARIESEVYSHLYNFFSRYYEDADFMSLRRHSTKSTYSIPYNGEEVMLHWANKDQYYIKSTEDLKDYAFTLEDGKQIHFKLSRMDAIQNNNKAARIFQLDEEDEIQATDDVLVIPFHFAEGKKRTNPQAATWEQEVLEALPAEWQQLLSQTDASFTGTGTRNILQKHLRNYTKKNTSDYFIHKDLCGFLNEELDFYIKNEVMYLDDVDNRPADYLEAEIRKIKAIRKVAKDLIDFVAQFENFQKKLWLKKKFVLESNWCITLDHIIEQAPDLLEEIAQNETQWGEWEKLGFLFETTANAGELGLGDQDVPPAGTVDYLRTFPYMVIDTAFYDANFKYKLLAATSDVEQKMDGLLIHSDNFQALEFMQARYKKQVKCVYIDPPYNTNSTPILYKNEYRHSSWASLMQDRLQLSMKLLDQNGVKCVAIDDSEMVNLSIILQNVAPSYRLSRVSVVHNPKGSITKDFNRVHEYSLFLTKDDGKSYIARTLEENSVPRKMRRWGENSLRIERRPSFYPIYVQNNKIVRIGDVPEDTFHPPAKNVHLDNGEVEIWPIDQNGEERRWNFGLESIGSNLDRITVIERDGELDLFLTHESTVPKTVWSGGEYDAGNYGNTLLIDILGEKRFDFPKSINLVKRCVSIMSDGEHSPIVLDYFGGSGTTAHATIELNREDDKKRKFILVEMGSYFDSVTKPRIQKVIFSDTWNQGKATNPASGISHCFKYIRLESYEDALNNLEIEDHTDDLLALGPAVQEDYLLRYMLDVETRGSLLNLARFEDPFSATLRIYNLETGKAVPKLIDLPETFNYLLGLRVRELMMRDGFLTIEGENPAGETVLIIWRNVHEKDNAALDAFVTGALRINTADTEYKAIYINGDTTLNDPHKKIMLTEEVFHNLMFDVTGL